MAHKWSSSSRTQSGPHEPDDVCLSLLIVAASTFFRYLGAAITRSVQQRRPRTAGSCRRNADVRKRPASGPVRRQIIWGFWRLRRWSFGLVLDGVRRRSGGCCGRREAPGTHFGRATWPVSERRSYLARDSTLRLWTTLGCLSSAGRSEKTGSQRKTRTAELLFS